MSARRAARSCTTGLRTSWRSAQIDLCIANGENSASGFGITPRIAEDLFASGIEVITGGNHIWDRREIFEFFPHEPRLLRPANFPNGSPGQRPVTSAARRMDVGYAVMNLQGRTFMAALDDPFRTADGGARENSART